MSNEVSGENKEVKKTSFTAQRCLIQLLGYLGKDLQGLTFSDGELFSMCVVGIVELKTKLANKETYIKQQNKQVRSLSRLDAFRDVLKGVYSGGAK
jgi:hypothetical protein